MQNKLYNIKTANRSFGIKFDSYVKIKIHKTIVVYGCETWSLILREDHRLRVFENRVLKRISGPKWDEIIGRQRTLH
jgi:hypothetical protein